MEDVTFKDLKLGIGKSVAFNDEILFHYSVAMSTEDLEKGLFKDSSLFSIPISCVLGTGQILKGLDIGIIGMKVGGQRLIFLTPKMGFAEIGAMPRIPPNSDLIFDIYLHRIL